MRTRSLFLACLLVLTANVSVAQDRTYHVILYDLAGGETGYGTTSFESINESNDIAGHHTTGPIGILQEEATHTTEIQCAPGAARTSLNGINNANEIAGWCIGAGNAQPPGAFGFLRLGNGQFQAIRYPGSIETQANAVNDKRQVVGSFRDQNTGRTRGYLWQNNRFTVIDGMEPTGINNAGVIVGYTHGADGHFQGVIRKPTGIQEPFNFPNATQTLPLDINEHKHIVGAFEDVNGAQLFIWTPTGFSVFRTTLPGVLRVNLSGINDKGYLVGNFALATGDPQVRYLLGFLAVPLPVPQLGTTPQVATRQALPGATLELRATTATENLTPPARKLTLRPEAEPCPTDEPPLPGPGKVPGWKLCYAG